MAVSMGDVLACMSKYVSEQASTCASLYTRESMSARGFASE